MYPIYMLQPPLSLKLHSPLCQRHPHIYPLKLPQLPKCVAIQQTMFQIQAISIQVHQDHPKMTLNTKCQTYVPVHIRNYIHPHLPNCFSMRPSAWVASFRDRNVRGGGGGSYLIPCTVVIMKAKRHQVHGTLIKECKNIFSRGVQAASSLSEMKVEMSLTVYKHFVLHGDLSAAWICSPKKKSENVPLHHWVRSYEVNLLRMLWLPLLSAVFLPTDCSYMML